MVKQILQYDSQALWQEFSQTHALTEEQVQQFKKYYSMLINANDLYNLTAITNLKSVLNDHFSDSMAISSFVDFSKINFISDVGSGAGFPGLPLKIKYPHLKVVLIEVTHKKALFLRSVIETLGLSDIQVSEYDWRTFLRKTDYPIELFCARASLQPEELLRAFKPSSVYNNATVVYWASKHWQETNMESPFVSKQESYTIGNKHRKLVFFSSKLLSEKTL